MWHIGLDVHWSVSVICVLDENGKELFTRKIRGTWDILLEELKKVKRSFKICFEASTGYGTLYDKLKPLAKQVIVAHPGHLRLIFRSKQKTDRLDARKLAKLLFLDEVPPVYVPSIDIRAWRGIIEHRNTLVKERTRSKNGVRAVLKSNGIKAPKGLWTRKGFKWLEELELLTITDTIRKDDLTERVLMTDRMIKRVDKQLKKIADRHPGVPLLMTIPGVGIRTAEAMVAYIDDPMRFRHSKSIGNYFGLIPCEDESAGKRRLGHITQEGPSTVRRLLTEAAWQAKRRSPEIQKRFEKIMRGDKKRKNIAAVAIAHYLARVILGMLRTGKAWNAELA